MEMIRILPLSIVCFLLISCISVSTSNKKITGLYVEDFITDDMDACKPSDVDLSNHEAKQFFLRSKKVEYKIIHDHYNVAPCHIEGALTLDGRTCEWKIQASAIGSMKCAGKENYYVCDTCDDLFN